MSKIKAVILAAGKGTRLRTEDCDLPKVLRRANGNALLSYVLTGLDFIPNEDIIIVVGYQREKVMEEFPEYTFAVQSEQLGTGHAVMSAAPLLENFDGALLVCCGDMPLIKRKTYIDLMEAHFREGNVCTILTGVTDEKLPYGRIVRDEKGEFLRMVEEKDCSAAELTIKELNAGVYIFDSEKLLSVLGSLKRDNAQGEYYLTDVPAILRERGYPVGMCRRELGTEIIGVNTIEQLREVEEILRREKARSGE